MRVVRVLVVSKVVCGAPELPLACDPLAVSSPRGNSLAVAAGGRPAAVHLQWERAPSCSGEASVSKCSELD